MQTLKNLPKILFASVLKPLDDPRMVLRQAAVCRSFSEVFVFGAPVSTPLPAGIRYFSSRKAETGPISRLAAGREFLKLLFRIRPDLLVLNAPDLLPIAVFYRLLFRKKIVYDIRENYWANFVFQENRPAGKRKLLAGSVRLTEKICAPFCRAFVLAEAAYRTELPFLKEPILLYENKFRAPENFVFSPRPAGSFSPENPHFVISGTLNRAYGILRGTAWFLALQKEIPGARLTIIGSCREAKYREELENLCKNRPAVQLIVSELTLSYREILNEIQQADIALMPYLPNPSTENCIPSKMYEYAVFGLPILLPANTLREEKLQQIADFVLSDFSPEKAAADYEKLLACKQNPGDFPDKNEAFCRPEIFVDFIRKLID